MDTLLAECGEGNTYLQKNTTKIVADEDFLIRQADRYASLLERRDAHAVMQRICSFPAGKVHRVHIYREIIVGAFLRQQGFPVRYEVQVGGKTPDWVCLNDRGEPRFIVEVVTVHPCQNAAMLMTNAFQRGKAWAFFVQPTLDRVWGKLIDKARIYRRLVTELDLPYVLAVFPGMGIVLEEKFQDEYLFGSDGIFRSAPYLSGMYRFRKFTDRYGFQYYMNPEANCAGCFPSGWLGDLSKA